MFKRRTLFLALPAAIAPSVHAPEPSTLPDATEHGFRPVIAGRRLISPGSTHVSPEFDPILLVRGHTGGIGVGDLMMGNKMWVDP